MFHGLIINLEKYSLTRFGLGFQVTYRSCCGRVGIQLGFRMQGAPFGLRLLVWGFMFMFGWSAFCEKLVRERFEGGCGFGFRVWVWGLGFRIYGRSGNIC